MNWFKRKDKKIKQKNKKSIPDGLWEKCPSCSEILFRPELDKSLSVCHHCDYHFRMNFKNYIDLIIDDGTSERLFTSLKSSNFLEFSASRDYANQLKDAYGNSGNTESIEIYSGKIKGQPLIMGIMNFDFIGGSVGAAEGEAIIYGVQHAIDNKTPYVFFPCGGGQRMFESPIALANMTRTTLAINELKKITFPT